MATFSQMIFENLGMRSSKAIANSKMICNNQDCGALLFKGEGETGHTSPNPGTQWQYNFQDFKKNAMIGNPEDFGGSYADSNFLYAEMSGILSEDTGALDKGSFTPPENYTEDGYIRAHGCIANAGIQKYIKKTVRIVGDQRTTAQVDVYCVFINGKLVYTKEYAIPILVTMPYGFVILAYENIMYNGLYTGLMYLDRVLTYTKYGDTKPNWFYSIQGEYFTLQDYNDSVVYHYPAIEFYSTSLQLKDADGFNVGDRVTFRSIAQQSTLPYRTIDINPSSSGYNPYTTKDYTYIAYCSLTELGSRVVCARTITPVFYFSCYNPGYVINRSGSFVEWYSGSLDWTDLYGNHYVPGSTERRKFYWRPYCNGILIEENLRNINYWSSSNPLISSNVFYSTEIPINPFTTQSGLPGACFIGLYPGATNSSTSRSFSNWGLILARNSDDGYYYLQCYQDDFIVSDWKERIFKSSENLGSSRYRNLSLIDFTISKNIVDITRSDILSQQVNFYFICRDRIQHYSGETYTTERDRGLLVKCTLDRGSNLYNISGHLTVSEISLGNYSFNYPGVYNSYSMGFDTMNQPINFKNLFRIVNFTTWYPVGSLGAVYDYEGRLIYPYGGRYLFIPHTFSFSNNDMYDMEPIIIDLDNIQGSLNYRNTG